MSTVKINVSRIMAPVESIEVDAGTSLNVALSQAGIRLDADSSIKDRQTAEPINANDPVNEDISIFIGKNVKGN